MKKKPLLIVLATAVPLIAFLASLAFLPETTPSTGASKDADKQSKIAAVATEVQRNIVALLYEAKNNYPVPFVRKHACPNLRSVGWKISDPDLDLFRRTRIREIACTIPADRERWRAARASHGPHHKVA